MLTAGPAKPTNPANPSQGLLAAGFVLLTALSTLNINGAELYNFVLLTFGFSPDKVAAAVPGTVALLAVLGERGGYIEKHLRIYTYHWRGGAGQGRLGRAGAAVEDSTLPLHALEPLPVLLPAGNGGGRGRQLHVAAPAAACRRVQVYI